MLISVFRRFYGWILMRSRRAPVAAHLRHGRLGENAARRELQAQGLKFLAANFSTPRGEIDLIFRDGDCLAFVEVKTRSDEHWHRPAAAVNRRKRVRLARAALDYLAQLGPVRPRFRFDIVEVLLEDGEVREVRHLPNAFPFAQMNYYP